MKILVFGATGNQGGRVARLLLEKGHSVCALTRREDSPSAQALTRLGAEMVAGDMNDRVSVERAARGVDAIFAMTTPFETGIEEEARQGITVADVAKAMGKYLVFSSVGAANAHTGIPHFETKWEVEKHIQKIQLEAAIIAPVFFMENVFRSAKQLAEGVYASPLPPDLSLQQIALDDLSAFAVLALEDRKRFAGKRIDLVSDERTGEQIAQILSSAIGRDLTYYQAPMDDIRNMSRDMAIMYEWLGRVGYSTDIPSLHREYPEINWMTYEAWAGKQDWKRILSV